MEPVTLVIDPISSSMTLQSPAQRTPERRRKATTPVVRDRVTLNGEEGEEEDMDEGGDDEDSDSE